MFERKTFKNHYEGAIEPFKIIGNTYFVGTFPASSHLIDTGDGLILIDTGYADTLFLLINSIYRLLDGFYIDKMIFKDKVLYAFPFKESRLSEEETAIAQCLIDMKYYIFWGR
ncbi:MAG: hypothetical protein IJE10_07370 [Clostridia bacterium]|nr:hypothetical protein [Clostridia bacterium]